MEIESLFGLPAHPLIVHAAVVLLPLAALATALCAVTPRARRTYGPVSLGLALAAFVAVGLAQGSGEELEHRVDRTALVRDHTATAERVLPWAGVLVVAATATAAAPYLERYRPSLARRLPRAAVGVASVVIALGAVVTVIDVGHSGAKATWHEVSGTSEPAGSN